MQRPIIVAKNVTFKYPGTGCGVTKVDFKVYPGECVGLIGPNGAGKSTFLLHLDAILIPQKGEVIVDNLNTLQPKDRLLVRQKVGFVFQDPNDQIFKNTVEEEVAYGPLNMGFQPEEVMQRVNKALRNVGLEGYNERITYNLSFGEKKKLSIASVLSMDPEILVFDEPTLNLDPQGVESLLNLLLYLKKQGKTLIIATHSIEFIGELADRCYVLDRGKIRKEGTIEAVLTDLEHLKKHGLRPTIMTQLFVELDLPQPYPLTLKQAKSRIESLLNLG
ncbi:MAG: energy-coupling factor ABC transporter ATP-binding protein [Promethearchaeota archaeon]